MGKSNTRQYSVRQSQIKKKEYLNIKKMKKLVLVAFIAVFLLSCKQTQEVVYKQSTTTETASYWQQQIDYSMDIDVDVNNYQYKGTQKAVYTNNSPDELTKVFYHLYFNAFQPGSQMDVRSLNIKDPDRRVGDRISKLQPNEIGYIKVNSLQQNGVSVAFETVVQF